MERHAKKNKIQAQRKRRKREKRSQASNDYEQLDEKLGLNTALGKLTPDGLADYIARLTKRFEKDATSVELQDHRVPGRWSQFILFL